MWVKEHSDDSGPQPSSLLDETPDLTETSCPHCALSKESINITKVLFNATTTMLGGCYTAMVTTTSWFIDTIYKRHAAQSHLPSLCSWSICPRAVSSDTRVLPCVSEKASTTTTVWRYTPSLPFFLKPSLSLGPLPASKLNYPPH